MEWRRRWIGGIGCRDKGLLAYELWPVVGRQEPGEKSSIDRGSSTTIARVTSRSGPISSMYQKEAESQGPFECRRVLRRPSVFVSSRNSFIDMIQVAVSRPKRRLVSVVGGSGGAEAASTMGVLNSNNSMLLTATYTPISAPHGPMFHIWFNSRMYETKRSLHTPWLLHHTGRATVTVSHLLSGTCVVERAAVESRKRTDTFIVGC